MSNRIISVTSDKIYESLRFWISEAITKCNMWDVRVSLYDVIIITLANSSRTFIFSNLMQMVGNCHGIYFEVICDTFEEINAQSYIL